MHDKEKRKNKEIFKSKNVNERKHNQTQVTGNLENFLVFRVN